MGIAAGPGAEDPPALFAPGYPCAASPAGEELAPGAPGIDAPPGPELELEPGPELELELEFAGAANQAVHGFIGLRSFRREAEMTRAIARAALAPPSGHRTSH